MKKNTVEFKCKNTSAQEGRIANNNFWNVLSSCFYQTKSNSKEILADINLHWQSAVLALAALSVKRFHCFPSKGANAAEFQHLRVSECSCTHPFLTFPNNDAKLTYFGENSTLNMLEKAKTV